MDPTSTASLGAAAAALLVLLAGLVWAWTRDRGARRRAEVALRSSRSDAAALEARLVALEARLPGADDAGADDAGADADAGGGSDGPARVAPAGTPRFTITSLSTTDGDAARTEVAPRTDGGAARFAAVAATESLVRVLSLGHGVRRALSADSRDRIRLAARREVRRARRARRDEVRAARRHLRSRRDAREDAA